MKENTNISLLFLTYITISGALYHLTFWQTFDINGLSLINITDIVKSAFFPVFPIVITIAYYLFINNISYTTGRGEEKENNSKFLKNGISNLWLVISIGIIQLLIALLYDFCDLYNPEKYYAQGFMFYFAIVIYLINNNVFVSYFRSEEYRRITIFFIVALPIISYYSGKYDSAEIFQNLKYKYTLNVGQPPNLVQSIDTLKFLGVTDKNYIYTDLKNSKIILLKSDNINSLTLYQKNK